MLYKHTFAWLFTLSILSSCALHNASPGLTQYQQAMLCYESGDYNEALRFFEEAIPLLRGKQEESSAYFCKAYCDFHQKRYGQSADVFKFFYKTFSRDRRVEEAMYMRGHVLYLASPDVRLDKVLTQEAAYVLCNYLKLYPEGVYVDEARTQLGELDNKLALKAFNSAKLYHQLLHYRAAVVTLENFQKDFPNSSYHEEAAYLKVDAQYRYFKEVEKICKYAKKYTVTGHRGSTPSDYRFDVLQDADKKNVGTLEKNKNVLQDGSLELEEVPEVDAKEQLSIAIRYCQDFIDSYPGSHYALAVGKIYKSLLLANKP